MDSCKGLYTELGFCMVPLKVKFHPSHSTSPAIFVAVRNFSVAGMLRSNCLMLGLLLQQQQPRNERGQLGEAEEKVVGVAVASTLPKTMVASNLRCRSSSSQMRRRLSNPFSVQFANGTVVLDCNGCTWQRRSRGYFYEF